MNNAEITKPIILCLINSAAYSRSYFERLAPLLNDRGHQVVFALDSHLTDVLYGNDKVLSNAWYFTDFIKENLKQIHTFEPTGLQKWTCLFSDFDRYLTLDIPPPLSVDGPVQYRHIPALLERFFAKVFKEVQPTAVLYEPVSNSFAIWAYEYSKKANIPFCSLSPQRIPGRIELSMTGALEDHITIGNLYRDRDRGGISDESRKAAIEYRMRIDQSTPDYMKTNGLDQVSLITKYLNSQKLLHFLKGWKYSHKQPEDCSLAYQHGNPVNLSKAFLKRAILRKLRLSRVLKHYTFDVVDEPFIVYPLHFHPEASTSVLAADYIDELSVIKAIAFRLPTTVKLYVKEHPSAVALQPLSFYRQLSSMPNVKLLGPQLPTKEIVRRSLGVITLTSTVGFEAAVLNKPVVTLGNVFYSYFPNVKSISDFSQLSNAIQWLMDYQPSLEKDLVDATAAYIEFGTIGSFDFYKSLSDPSALIAVADVIDRKLKK